MASPNARCQHNPLSAVPQAPEDAMFGLSAAYRSDDSPDKVDLGVGAYRDDAAKPWILPVVEQADEILRQLPDLNHEYLPIAGLSDYLDASQKLVLGQQSAALEERRVASLQTLSGTGALHLGFLFLSRFVPMSPSKQVYVSTPPYANHIPILDHVSLRSGYYPYYSRVTKGLDITAMLNKLASIPPGSIVLLHACAHNPTGVDPSRSQWREIAQAMKEKTHLPVFDLAYQGLATGDIDADAWAIRYFVEQGFEVVMIAQSYAKNLGLYGERAGCLHLVAATAEQADRSLSQLKKIQRVEISTPPAYGARIVSLILNDERLFAAWLQDLGAMAGRIAEMRVALRERLEADGTPGPWNHITEQKGMFCFSGLTETDVAALRNKHHIYTTRDGRFSMSGLNRTNAKYVAEAIRAVIKQRSRL